MTDSKYIDEIFNNITLDAKVIQVYDGDTCTIEFPFPGVVKKDDSSPLLVKFKLRMLGYDTAEKRTRNKNEKRIAYLCRDALSNKILNKDVQVECASLDKYGRLLGKITYDNEDINQYMLDSNFGYIYTGGTKAKVTYNEDNSYIINGVTYLISI